MSAPGLLEPPPVATAREGFARAQWRTLGAIMVCYLFFYTGRQNLGFAVPGMRGELGYSASAIAALNASMLLGYGLGQTVNGNLSDMVGARRMVAIGAALSFLLNWAMSFAVSPALAVAAWFANGAAQSTGSPALRRLIVDWFPQRQRGRANGFHLLSAGCSSSLTYALCIAVVSVLNWRWVFRLPVTTILLGTSIFLLLARNKPEDAGFDPLPPDPEEPSGPSETFLQRYRAVLSNGGFGLACLSIGFESMARYGLLGWVPVHFLGAGSGSQAGLWVTLGLPIGMAAGALSAGIISDRWFPQRRAAVAGLLMAGAALAAFLLSLLPRHSPYAFVLLAVAGFLVYAPQASYWSLGPVLVGRRRAGTATGLMDAAAYGFAALGQLVIGVTIDRSGSTAPVFVVIAVACLAGAVAILPVRR
jgi:OPA family glycerol-3-phosphate transporter-like MFS transporter